MATPLLVQATHNQINTLPAGGLNVVLPAAASVGDAVFAIIVGQKNLDPYTQRTDSNPYNSILNATPAPVINDNEYNSWSTVKTFQMIDLLTSPPALPTPPYPFPNATPVSESIANYDAKFPSIYLGAALNVAAGTQSVNIRASYQPLNNDWAYQSGYLVGDAVVVTGVSGTWPFNQTYTTYVCAKAIVNPQPWSATTAYTIGQFVTVAPQNATPGATYVAIANQTGQAPASHPGSWTSVAPGNATYWTVVASPSTDARFAGGPGQNVFTGLDIVLLDFSGIATSAAVDGTAVSGTSEANPATAGTITTTQGANEVVVVVGIQKNGNNIQAPAAGSPPTGPAYWYRVLAGSPPTLIGATFPAGE
jgi:hypothetical protein